MSKLIANGVVDWVEYNNNTRLTAYYDRDLSIRTNNNNAQGTRNRENNHGTFNPAKL